MVIFLSLPFLKKRTLTFRVRSVSDLVDYSSFRRNALFPFEELSWRRLRSSYNRAARLIRLTELLDQPIFRVSRGTKPKWRQTLLNISVGINS